MSDTSSNSSSTDWDAIGYVVSSKYRKDVLQRLVEGPATPSRMGEDTGYDTSHVSRAVKELREYDLVHLLVSEDTKKGRVYAATDTGEELWETIVTDGLDT